MTRQLLDMRQRKNKNPMIQDFIDNVIIKSWTWERLTEEEQALTNGVLAGIQSKAKTHAGASKTVNHHYGVLLATFGYKPIGWREGEECS
ncbi:MAG: hypothetical protein LBQ15_11150 [Clostridium sp.]|jgi:hypothetical protein|nr:hypothetical protein [Clostridium sp.]